MPTTFPKTVVAPPGRAARAPNDLVGHDNARCRPRSSSTRPGPPSAAPIGPPDRRRPIPRLDWLSRLSISLVPAPLASPPSPTWCLPGLREFACPRGAEGSDLGVKGEGAGRVRGGVCVVWCSDPVGGQRGLRRGCRSQKRYLLLFITASSPPQTCLWLFGAAPSSQMPALARAGLNFSERSAEPTEVALNCSLKAPPQLQTFLSCTPPGTK